MGGTSAAAAAAGGADSSNAAADAISNLIINVVTDVVKGIESQVRFAPIAVGLALQGLKNAIQGEVSCIPSPASIAENYEGTSGSPDYSLASAEDGAEETGVGLEGAQAEVGIGEEGTQKDISKAKKSSDPDIMRKNKQKYTEQQSNNQAPKQEDPKKDPPPTNDQLDPEAKRLRELLDDAGNWGPF